MKVESSNSKLPAMAQGFLLLRTPEPPYIAVISTNIHSGKCQVVKQYGSNLTQGESDQLAYYGDN